MRRLSKSRIANIDPLSKEPSEYDIYNMLKSTTNHNSPLIAFSFIKMHYPGIGEVDIYSKQHNNLCEVAAGNKIKNLSDVRMDKYYKNISLIRVHTTQPHGDMVKGIHCIPVTKLCCMIDTGEIFNLSKTMIASL